MTRVDFYDGSARYPGDPLALPAALAAKAHLAGAATVILAADCGQAQALDERLWDLGETVFVPHALADDVDAAAVSVLIAAPGQAVPIPAAVVINLRDAAVELDCPRIIEIIPVDETGRAAARARWRAYQARGLKPARVDLPAR